MWFTHAFSCLRLYKTAIMDEKPHFCSKILILGRKTFGYRCSIEENPSIPTITNKKVIILPDSNQSIHNPRNFMKWKPHYRKKNLFCSEMNEFDAENAFNATYSGETFLDCKKTSTNVAIWTKKHCDVSVLKIDWVEPIYSPERSNLATNYGNLRRKRLWRLLALQGRLKTPK